MSRLKVTQIRSTIGTKRNQRETLRTLGLKGVHDVVVRDDRPEVRGMVNTVTHLVTVEVLDNVTVEVLDNVTVEVVDDLEHAQSEVE